jgi:pSer/pThr/pTyr-binding forkhead associated (FHA) protein
MSRLQIPYDQVLLNPRDFDPEEFDTLLRHFINVSDKHPLVLEIFNDHKQYFVFINEGRPYWACERTGEDFNAVTLKKFFGALRRLQFPQVVVYFTSLVLYHSLLVYLQKKPELKIDSSLVDFDDLLDRTEAANNSAVVTAYQPGNLIMLRYQGGKPIACYHGSFEDRAPEGNIREDFLVKVYTLSAHSSFIINLFTDLVVTHAEDSRPFPSDYQGSVSSFYLCQPPKLIVKLKNRPLKTYPFTGRAVTIGRLAQNDIVIDNLSVSRMHASISKSKDGYTLTDLGSKNGTYVNGQLVETALLKDDDRITIGKYEIIFQIPQDPDSCSQDMDQTVIIPNYHTDASKESMPVESCGPAQDIPRLYRQSDNREYELNERRTTIGKGKDADIRLKGLFAPRIRVEIAQKGNNYVLQRVSGSKKVRINGEEIDEKVLEEEDLIAIGTEEFVFKR